MTKIYLAGSCGIERRTEMKRIASALRAKGYSVYCPFELKIENAWDYSQEEWSEKVFIADTMAIDSCDIFVMISPGRVSTAGTNWEQGYAYANGKKILVIQHTTEPASLMTFCGCNYFMTIDNIDEIAESVETFVYLSNCADHKFIKHSEVTLT